MSGTSPVDNAVDTKTPDIVFLDNGALPSGTVNIGHGTITVSVNSSGGVLVSIPRLLPPASRLNRGDDQDN